MKAKDLTTDKLEIPLKHKKSGKSCELNGKLEEDIKASKRRKKKRKNELNNVSTVPEKKVKTKQVTDYSEENNLENGKGDNHEISDQEETENVKISKEESNKFNGKFLRNSFNSADGFDVLQKFVTICNQSNNEKDLAAEYLQAGGSVLEILRLLDSSEKKNINNASTVFSAMHIIIMKILSQYPQHQSSAEEACRHLINSHLASIHSMLSSQSKAKHRKIILKLLAAVVSLGGTLPRELLNHLSLHSELVEFLVSHTKPTDPQNVRTCFIHFILAFLVEGNASDIRTLLEKRGVLSSIFSGLIYDYPEVVQLVLTTVKKYVLENSVITKTIKLHVFSTTVSQGIINLYNWKGPKNWSSHKKQKSSTTEYVDPEEKEIVINAVHEFLIILLTSNRYGIAFHDRKLGLDSSRKHNQLINTVLQGLDKPWEHDKPSDLIIKILTACPDLIKSQLTHIEPFLVPRVSKKWIAVIEFIRKVINNIDVENCLKLCSADMTITQLANAISNLTLPPIVIKGAVVPALQHSSPLIHYEIINLILVMIRKIENFIVVFDKIKSNIIESSTLKNNLQEHLVKHIPSFETILSIWTKAISADIVSSEADEKDVYIDIKDRLQAILNLLEAYSDICPEILLASSVNLENKSIILLTDLTNLPNVTEEELILMKVKALKILLNTDMTNFAPNKEIFASVLSFLMTQVGKKVTLFDLEVRKTIHLLLSNCGIFEGFNDQIEIWIDAITHLQSYDDKLEVANWIAKIIKRVSKNIEQYLSLIYETEKNSEEEIINVNRMEDIFNELSEKNREDVKHIIPMLPITSISLLVYGAVENLKKKHSNALAHYISIVLTHILHCQVSPKPFLSLIEELHIPAQKYLVSWSSNDSPISLKKPFNSNDIFRNISKILLNSVEQYSIDIKESKLYITLDESVNEYTLTNFEIKALVRMVIFYLTQILRKANTEVLNISVYTNTLLVFLKLANEVEVNSENLIKECIKWIFKNPIFLHYFKGIYGNKDVAEYASTKLFIEICTLLYELNKQPDVLLLMQPYQEKFINQVKSTLKRDIVKNLEAEVKVHIELIKFLQLDIKSIVDLLTVMMNLKREKFLVSDKSALSIWGIIIPELINQFIIGNTKSESGSFITIQDTILKKLFNYLLELKIVNKDMDLWENSLYKYLLKFPHNISAVDMRIFTKLLETNLTSTTEKILTYLCQQNFKFITAFIKHANSNEKIFEQKSLFFSILSSDLKYQWNPVFLQKVFEFYKKDIILYLVELKTNELPWIHENVDSTAFLINNNFDSKLCLEICKMILTNSNKLDAAQEEHIKLFYNAFKKSAQVNENAMKDFVQLLLHITVTALKRDSKNVAKLNFFCTMMIDIINTLKSDSNFSFEELSKSNSWTQFTRISLKSGLNLVKGEKKKTQTSSLLKALAATCEVAYKDNCCEEYVKTIFEMTTSHSEFTNVMLSNTDVKIDLVKLLWTLIRKNHNVMLKSHIPLYLASFNATLSESDQFITKILRHYENNNIKLTDYSPYLWGNAAALHYSVKGGIDTALWRESSISQVLDLLVPEIVSSTIKHFPIMRNLEGDFINIENNADQIYDPTFYLGVLCSLLKDCNDVACHKVVHSGALALTIIACSSNCDKVRFAAYTVISRFYNHLQSRSTTSKERLLWIHFIETLRNGIAKTEEPLEKIRLNGFIATFLSRATLVMSQPLNPLYSALHAFLMAKPALDLDIIPEFLPLFHSSEIEHRTQRHWILEIVCDGFKINEDMDIALKYLLFKMLLCFYNCVLSDDVTKNLILQIIRSATKLTRGCMILVNGYSLLPWLINTSINLSKGHVDSIACIIDIANHILDALQKTKTREMHHYILLTKILLNLKLHFHQTLPLECFQNYIKVLNRTLIDNSVSNVITKNDVEELVKFSEYLLKDVNECEAMLQFGCTFVKKNNHEFESDLEPIENLRRLIITWYSSRKKL